MKSKFDRQSVEVALVELTPEDIAAGGVSVKIARGTWVHNVVGVKVTAFNTAGDTPTVTLTATDGTATFINAQALTGTGAITAAVTSKFYPDGGTITLVITEGVASGD